MGWFEKGDSVLVYYASISIKIKLLIYRSSKKTEFEKYNNARCKEWDSSLHVEAKYYLTIHWLNVDPCHLKKYM